MSTEESTLVRISVADLVIDPAVQREQIPAWVRELADTMNLRRLGMFTASRREDGTRVVLDGGHRKLALELAGFPDHVVLCEMFEGLTIQEEADLFLSLNYKRTVAAIPKFLVSVTRGDETSTLIADLLKRHEWRVSSAGEKGCFGAIAALQRLYERNPAAAQSTIEAITCAFQTSPEASNHLLISGLGMVFIRYPKLDPIKVGDRIGSDRGGLKDLMLSARAIKGARPQWSMSKSVADVVVTRYNTPIRNIDNRLVWN